MEQAGVQLTAEGANAYIRDLMKAADANNALDKSAQQTANAFADMASAADKIKLQSLNNQLADQKNRLTALSAELERQGNAYDFTSKKALDTAVAYRKLEGQAAITEARFNSFYAELSKPIPVPAPVVLPEPKSYTPNLGGMVRDLKQVADSSDLATRSLNLMERELDDMKSSFTQNTARINDLRSALQLASISTEQDEKANNALEKELRQLITTNDKLVTSIEKRSIALDKAKAPKPVKAEPTQLVIPDLTPTIRDNESGIQSFIGSIGGLASAYVSLEAAATFAIDGLRLTAELEQSRLTIQTLAGSVEKGNAIYAEAIAFGQKFGYTQQEMATAAAQATTIISKTNQTTEKTLEVLGRLASLNPAEGFEGAVIAFKELASGDITSIAERFNIARGEANAMKNAIASGADPVQVLDAALAKMNVTSDVLANRMKGTNGALLDAKLAFEDAKLASGEFLTAIGAPEMLQNFANGLKFVTDKVREYIGLMQQAQGINPATGEKQATATTGLDAANFQAYQEQNQAFIQSQQQADAAIMQRNANLGILGNVLTVVGGVQKLFTDDTINGTLADRALTETEFGLAQAFMQRGLSQQDAAAKAIQLNMATSATDNALAQLSGTEAVTAQQSQALQAEIIALATAHPAYTDQIFNTINAELAQGATSQELSSAIQQLSDDIAYNELEQTRLESATLLTAGATDEHTASVYELTAAQLEDIDKKLQAAQAAEKQAQWEQDLAFAVDASQNSALGAAGAALYLSQAYGIEYNQALKLLSATNALNEARAGRQGKLAGQNLGNILGATLDQMEGVKAGRITAPYEAPKRGGSKGKKAGKSEEVKAAEKREKELAKIEKRIVDEKAKYDKKKEELAKAHVEKLAAIEAEYQRKSLEAEKKFNTDKFNVRNNFKGSILDIDKDLWDAARAEEVAYWNESQAIAQSGDAKRAEAFYDAAQEYASLKAQHAQELRDLDAQIAASTDSAEQAELAERKRRLEEYYAEQELLAKEAVDKLRTGENELAKERDEAIAEENSRYTEANNELEQNFKDTVAELIADSDELQSAVVDMVSALIPSFASLAQAARDAAAAAGSVGAVPAAEPVPAMNSGGFVARNRPVLVGDGPGGRITPHTEMFVPKSAGTILPADTTRSILATPQQIYNRSQTRMANTTNTVTNNYNLGIQTNNSPRVVEQGYNQMKARGK